ncbi:MAG: SDR family NAD(P)-dependent oxidoreductase [SAR324 cluster bacterium]|nr:SDR family NAD(P)-dependent oxidoreductase [SAR324 cluster bacterium]
MAEQIKTLHLHSVLKEHSQDMTGKVVVITGTTSGTGFVAAKEIAKKGAKVILLNRKSKRADKSLKALQAAVPAANFVMVDCDLQSFDSVNLAVDNILENNTSLDVLINNAGVMALEDYATVDGYDVQMQTNVLSHFLITKRLFPLLQKSQQGRIVNHSSMARMGGPLELKYFGKNGGDLGGDGSEEENMGFSGPRWARYHQTKLANFTFTYGLKNRLEKAGISNVIALVAHPGLASTNLQVTTTESGGMDMEGGLMSNAQSAEDGAAGIIRAAMSPTAKCGDFYGPELWSGYPELREPEADLISEANLKTNWEGCEAAVGNFSF